ncbi:4-hydroxy-tetrahydrodipicolinate synthase [Propionispora hippei]|uniref:4-hydroxy-tetrahydrodipicolinate synthase n=1 Tax=Propionispora hippei DSM 15287 TaxID=1123003 RepID=A0A1M6D962_9FIRM|nr:4-hydroxy-tetrahydrodipicolinate synthase [Propionispora hippei]SHI69765.1 4-hydroxy-tetrahydrodipicolinate synthase [Propionispora hippei DSM 15287]
MRNFGRVFTAMVTPFHEDLRVNYAAAAQLATHLAANGSDGLVIAGTTGESPTLTQEEKLNLFSTVLEAVGDRVTVIAGTGSNDTQHSIEMTREAEKLGVHGAMLVGPYYNKPNQEGYYQHFKAIAESTALPLIVYNVPGRTGSNISPDTIVRLAAIKNIVAVKEASGSLDQASEIVRRAPAGFMVYSGDDSLTLPILAVGGVGVISVASHIIGRQIQNMIAAFAAGDVRQAQAIHGSIFPFYKLMFINSNPIPVKTAVNLLGLSAGPCRLPLTTASAGEVEQIKESMRQLGIM